MQPRSVQPRSVQPRKGKKSSGQPRGKHTKSQHSVSPHMQREKSSDGPRRKTKNPNSQHSHPHYPYTHCSPKRKGEVKRKPPHTMGTKSHSNSHTGVGGQATVSGGEISNRKLLPEYEEKDEAEQRCRLPTDRSVIPPQVEVSIHVPIRSGVSSTTIPGQDVETSEQATTNHTQTGTEAGRGTPIGENKQSCVDLELDGEIVSNEIRADGRPHCGAVEQETWRAKKYTPTDSENATTQEIDMQENGCTHTNSVQQEPDKEEDEANEPLCKQTGSSFSLKRKLTDEHVHVCVHRAVSNPDNTGFHQHLQSSDSVPDSTGKYPHHRRGKSTTCTAGRCNFQQHKPRKRSSTSCIPFPERGKQQQDQTSTNPVLPKVEGQWEQHRKKNSLSDSEMHGEDIGVDKRQETTCSRTAKQQTEEVREQGALSTQNTTSIQPLSSPKSEVTGQSTGVQTDVKADVREEEDKRSHQQLQPCVSVPDSKGKSPHHPGTRSTVCTTERHNLQQHKPVTRSSTSCTRLFKQQKDPPDICRAPAHLCRTLEGMKSCQQLGKNGSLTGRNTLGVILKCTKELRVMGD